MSTRTFTLYVCIQYSVCCLYTCKEFIYFDHRSCKNLSTMSNDRKVFRRQKKKSNPNLFIYLFCLLSKTSSSRNLIKVIIEASKFANSDVQTQYLSETMKNSLFWPKFGFGNLFSFNPFNLVTFRFLCNKRKS